ncbi:MAG: hypothetical protein ACRDPW_07715 [Mycobacteriales bacterium]
MTIACSLARSTFGMLPQPRQRNVRRRRILCGGVEGAIETGALSRLREGCLAGVIPADHDPHRRGFCASKRVGELVEQVC